MSKEKQIEEMADILCEAKEHDCKGGNDCLCVKQAESIYNAGYRKQIEGEWKQAYNNYPRYVCTNCNHLFNNKTFKYCPNCGAKMKGGAK